MKILLLLIIVTFLLLLGGAAYFYYIMQHEEIIELAPEYEKVSIIALNYDLDKYLGKKVTVAGYFGHGKYYGEDNASFLILDYKRLLLDEPLLYGIWIRLDGNVPSEEYDGYIIQVSGVVKKYTEVYGGPSLYEVPLITVEEYSIVSETEYSSIAYTESFKSADFLQVLQGKVKDCDRVLIISGGVDKHNNHPRYKRNIKEKYEKMKSLGFKDKQITIIYYDGNDFTINGKKIDVKYSATKENIKKVIDEYLKEMDPCCTLYIFVTDHGYGYDPEQGDGWGSYKIKPYDPSKKPDLFDPKNGDPGKRYKEKDLTVDCRDLEAKGKEYTYAGVRWAVDYVEHTKTYKVWKFEGGKWKLVAAGKDEDGDGKISEKELGIDMDNNPGNNLKFDKNDFTDVVHYSQEFKLKLDGEKEYKIEYKDGKFKIFIKDSAGNWRVIGEDKNGDKIINKNDDGIDLNNDGDKNDEYTFHESICLYNGEDLWDYELAQMLKKLHDKGIHIFVEMGQCFGGGFIKNLEGVVDRIATAADEDKKAIGLKNRWSIFEHYFVQKLTKLTAEGWDEAFKEAVKADENEQKTRWGKFSDTPQLGKPPQKPDLVVKSVIFSYIYAPFYACANEEVPIAVTIRNVGWAAAKKPTVKLYVDGKFVGEKTLNAELKPNEEAKIEFKYTFKKKGKVKIEAVVNEEKKIEEVFYDNNRGSFEAEIYAPDLKIKNISYSPEKIKACTKVKFKVVIENSGPCLAKNFDVKILILGKAEAMTAPVFFEKDFKIDKLEPWKNKTIEFEYLFKESGKYTVKAIADYENVVVEENENNNDKKVEIEVLEREKLPDFGVELIGPQQLLTNTLYRFEATITNYGEVEASTLVWLNISDGRSFESGVVLVPAGGKVNVTFFIDFSAPGSYLLTATVDPYNTVREHNETNNVHSMYVVVVEKPLPDLVVSYLKVCYTTYVGEYSYMVINCVNFTVSNFGLGESPGNIVVYVWVDDPSNVIDQYTYAGGLESGESFNYTLLLEYETTYGTHTVGATVDPDNNIAESNEDNNTTSVQISPTVSQRFKVADFDLI